jgi:hypothetical protein
MHIGGFHIEGSAMSVELDELQRHFGRTRMWNFAPYEIIGGGGALDDIDFSILGADFEPTVDIRDMSDTDDSVEVTNPLGTTREPIVFPTEADVAIESVPELFRSDGVAEPVREQIESQQSSASMGLSTQAQAGCSFHSRGAAEQPSAMPQSTEIDAIGISSFIDTV